MADMDLVRTVQDACAAADVATPPGTWVEITRAVTPQAATMTLNLLLGFWSFPPPAGFEFQAIAQGGQTIVQVRKVAD
jgi:hypothetical protein